ncbi:MAG TPA: GGDEF domain-containing protein [Sphaerochaeta sp.]|jgi:diguanylate cyclase (GGDEF)-like protein|nr:GGDEF domain-containing protein [Sphaerochaeta sp.]HPZ15353.1 GGDEF domain-containing protein [Sphaerochaeta sp.]
MKRVGKGRTSYRTLAARNKAAIDAYNRHNLFVLSLMGALMMLIPIASAPYSTSKRSLLPVYIVLMVCILLLTVVSRVPSFERFTLIGLYVGFSVFFALAVYLSVFNSPHMRATILIGVFCIVPLAFIDNPLRMNLFIATWFVIHTALAYIYKRPFVLDDAINTLAFAIMGGFFGTITTKLRVRSYEDQRLLVIKGETDALTGLYNRHKLFETLAGKAREPLSGIMMIDIDHFKEYNDHYGHIVADEAMQHLASILKEVERRASITFYRYGGEEFVGLAYALTELELASHSEALRGSVESAEVGTPAFTISIGVAYCGDEANPSYQKVIKQADEAVFEAKRSGRNRVVMLRAL